MSAMLNGNNARKWESWLSKDFMSTPLGTDEKKIQIICKRLKPSFENQTEIS